MKRIAFMLLTAVILSLVYPAGAYAAGETTDDTVEVLHEEKRGIYEEIELVEEEFITADIPAKKKSEKKSAAFEDPVDAAYNYAYNYISEDMASGASGTRVRIDLIKNGIFLTRDRYIDNDNYQENGNMNLLIHMLSYQSGELLLSKRWSVAITRSEPNGMPYISSISTDYIFDRSVIMERKQEMTDVCDSFISNMEPSLSDIEKVLLTHDYVCRSTIYQLSEYENIKDEDLTAEQKFDKYVRHSMYGTIVLGYSVCQGYTEAMCYILNRLGVECIAAISDKINHAWNVVKADGKWYYVDATWDDRHEMKVNNGNGTVVNKTFDFIEYKHFMTGADTLIQYKYTNDGYIYEDGDIEFCSTSLSHNDVEMTGKDDGYIFNDIKQALYMPKGVLYILAPTGFEYENGRFIQTIKTDYPQIAPEYVFEYDGIRAMGEDMSRPALFKRTTADNQTFLFFRRGEASAAGKILMSDEDMNIYDIALTQYFVLGDYYACVSLYDTKKITDTEGARFFFWGTDQKPVSYSVSKQ